ncbi:MAG: hypothetical protein HY819_06120 [Acidobacteria bacterium]|nr:hypothetical protein [Acidobacteriota bacterium]
MRLKINLAQKPFYNRRLFWLSFLVAVGLMFWATQWTFEKIEQTQDVSKKLQEAIKKQELEIKGLEKIKPPPVQTLTPKQIQEIEDAAQLIKQRRFSWTKLMEEFEQALPKEVRIIGISPSKGSETTDIPLSVKVYARSVEDLTKMIAKMDKEGVFLVNPTNQEVPVQSGDIGFSLDVSYKPRSSKIAKSKKAAEVKQVVDQGGEDE